MMRFGWFTSGRDQAALDLFQAAAEEMARGFIPGKIAYVFVDRDPGESPAADRVMAAVKARGLPLVTLSSRELREALRRRLPEAEAMREAFDARVMELVRGHQAEVVVLAGYMLIVSPLLCRTLLCLNLHPALPGGPVGTWQEVMWQIIAQRLPEAGAMMHLATPELDKGPPVTFCRFSTRRGHLPELWAALEEQLRHEPLAALRAREGETQPLFQALRAEELRREFPLILLTLKSLAEGRIHLTREGAVVDGVLRPQGLDLTPEVEEMLAREGRA
jgi:phosphoribosylglycinamide formyltransferase-1